MKNELLLFSAFTLCGTVCANPTSSSKDVYSGGYFGGGISYQYTRGDILLNDNYGACDFKLRKTRFGKVGGSLVLGYSDFIADVLNCGVELTVDVAGNKSSNFNNPDSIGGKSKVKTQGIVPTFALKLGSYISSIDSLIYARAGVSVISHKFKSDMFGWKEVKSQSVVPVIGLGFEKKVYDNCSLKIEGDYRLSASKKKSEMTGYDDTGIVLPAYHSSVKNKVSGYAVRMICIYHF